MKILASTFLGSLLIALIISSGYLYDGNIKGFLFFALISTAVGFGVYGLVGSCVWWLFQKHYFNNINSFKSHIISATVGVTVLALIFILCSAFGFIGVGEAFLGIILSLTGAFASILIYWIIFYRCLRNA